MPTLTVVIPHWPLDVETDTALRRCVASLPPDCERVVVVNDGTGYGHNVNVGLRLAAGEYVAVVNNDCRLSGGHIFDLCVPGTVTSPLVIGERQGLGESIEPGGFHGCFWVAPRLVLNRVSAKSAGRFAIAASVRSTRGTAASNISLRLAWTGRMNDGPPKSAGRRG